MCSLRSEKNKKLPILHQRGDSAPRWPKHGRCSKGRWRRVFTVMRSLKRYLMTIMIIKHTLTNVIKGWLNERPINPRSDLFKDTLTALSPPSGRGRNNNNNNNNSEG